MAVNGASLARTAAGFDISATRGSLMLLFFASCLTAFAADPLPPIDGKALVEEYFRDQTDKLTRAALADIKTLDGWKTRRPELHRQFLEMLDLWPLPPRTPLNAKV